MLTPAFARLLTDAQFSLFSYILLLVGDATDARDVLQDTNLVMLRDAAHFIPGTSFMAWAKTLAYYQVLTYRKKRSRDRLVFDDEVFQRLTAKLEERREEPDRRLDAIHRCIGKLGETQRSLVAAKYFERLSVDAISERFDCSPAAVVSLLYRVRRLLARCVETTLREEAV
jgi:RNA polymerase sigma-70 factor (ECF subfamily)